MKNIQVNEGDNRDTINAINEELTRLNDRVNTLTGVQGSQKMLGNIDLNGFRLINVGTRDFRDAITESNLQTNNEELLDEMVYWALILGG